MNADRIAARDAKRPPVRRQEPPMPLWPGESIPPLNPYRCPDCGRATHARCSATEPAP